jgi:hypothetical protein
MAHHGPSVRGLEPTSGSARRRQSDAFDAERPDWLDPLVAGGRALSTSNGGYPERYLIICADFRSCLEQGMPAEKPVWTADPGDVLTDRWIGHTAVEADALAQCDPDEWLLVQAWDES